MLSATTRSCSSPAACSSCGSTNTAPSSPSGRRTAGVLATSRSPCPNGGVHRSLLAMGAGPVEGGSPSRGPSRLGARVWSPWPLGSGRRERAFLDRGGRRGDRPAPYEPFRAAPRVLREFADVGVHGFGPYAWRPQTLEQLWLSTVASAGMSWWRTCGPRHAGFLVAVLPSILRLPGIVGGHLHLVAA